MLTFLNPRNNSRTNAGIPIITLKLSGGIASIAILNKENYLAIEDIIDDLKNHPRDPSINHEWTNHSKNLVHKDNKNPF